MQLSSEHLRKLRITGFELLPIRASERTVWLIVRLQTDAGLIGLGEASDAFGFANTTEKDVAQMKSELRRFFKLIEGKSPLEINTFVQQSRPLVAKGGLVSATASSAIEQALWDLAGKSQGVPTYQLLGKKLRNSIPVYANINRATKQRVPSGFAATARAAVKEGFHAVKAAPFDGFPVSGSAAEKEKAVENGIACMIAMREAIGPEIGLMVDCHSFFDVELAERVAQRLETCNLKWYEEPLPVEKIEETLEVCRRIKQPMAGGEMLYGVSGFEVLLKSQALQTIMPDVKHCGGLLELTRIAVAAESANIDVAPHNPSGPISTAASAQVCAGLRNCRMLEFQWGEVEWRKDLLIPPEEFKNGEIQISERPGLGIELNEELCSRLMSGSIIRK